MPENQKRTPLIRASVHFRSAHRASKAVRESRCVRLALNSDPSKNSKGPAPAYIYEQQKQIVISSDCLPV
jgi:hypothetical protein